LQYAHARLGIGLLVASRRHAEQRLEGVVAGQGGVTLVGPALATLEDLSDDGGGVVPLLCPASLCSRSVRSRCIDAVVAVSSAT
jgi:hypothetical protein